MQNTKQTPMGGMGEVFVVVVVGLMPWGLSNTSSRGWVGGQLKLIEVSIFDERNIVKKYNQNPEDPASPGSLSEL